MPRSWCVRSAALPSVLILSGLLLGGCASNDRSRSGILTPYRIEVPQGNYVDQPMLNQVQTGMTREQVRFALGTPLLIDPFRPDRWDYVFRFQHPSGESDLRRATIYFVEGKVTQIEADAMPASDEGVDPALPGYRRKQGRFR